MYTFTCPRELFDERYPNKQSILNLIHKHANIVQKLRENRKYYDGQHDIATRTKKDKEAPNNKLVCNHAKDIADTATGYFIGNPVSYKSDVDITPLTDAFDDTGIDEVDGDNGLDMSIYGLAYEYVYAKEDEAVPTSKNLPPENTFMVYDDTIEQNELFAVYYFAQKDDVNDRQKFIATVLTENYKHTLIIIDSGEPQTTNEEPIQHFFGEVPVIEYRNNKNCNGDFAGQIPLIDAYNMLMSDRVNDKEQFINSILAVYGAILADDGETAEAIKALKELGLMELPSGAKAEYITRTFDEQGVEVLKKAIEQDIHKFSHVPCMTDENFGGNVSGVAMEFKLLGLENITKTKTRYYKKGLRKRLRLYCNFLSKKGINIDPTTIKMTFTRGLPKNLLEISQIVSNLWGKVSKKTLLSQIPFVEDIESELQAIEQEEQENIKKQQEMFGNQPNTPPQDNEENNDDETPDSEIDDE